MPSNRKLGINFGLDALDIVEVEKQNIIAHYNIPYLETQDKSEVVEVADEIKLAAILQKSLRDKRIKAEEVFATVPSKDVLLRSFVIPVLPKNEIKTAVDFEARKHVPIKLDALYFDYLLQKIVEKRIRKLKTLFIGIKKEVLDKFIYALENSNLKVLAIETAPFSLQRILSYKKLIKPNSNIALVEANKKDGSICIIEKGFPQLIRDFKFATITKDIYAKEPENLSTLLNKEIRLSFDYYRRQSNKIDTNKIYLFTEEKDEQLKDSLSKELNISVTAVQANEVLGSKQDINNGILKAYGATLRNIVKRATVIDLYRKRKVEEAREAAEAEIPEVPVSSKSVIRTMIIAGVFVLLFYLFVDFNQISALQEKIKTLTQKRATLKTNLSSMDVLELESLKATYKDNIKTLQEAKESYVANYTTPLLDRLPSLLTEGIWLSKLNFKSEPELGLALEGMAYLEGENEQMNSVNKFFNNIKESQEFKEAFSTIDLDYIKQAALGGFSVRQFGITCR